MKGRPCTIDWCPNDATIGDAYCDGHRCAVARERSNGTYECSRLAHHGGPCAAIPICPKCGGECELFDMPGRPVPAIRCLKNGCTWNMDFTPVSPLPCIKGCGSYAVNGAYCRICAPIAFSKKPEGSLSRAERADFEAANRPHRRRINAKAKMRRFHENMDVMERKHAPFWRRDLVDKTPIVTTILLESANVQQLYRMWTEHSALGQSLTAWIAVNVALLLWLNYYRVKGLRWALYSTFFGVTMSISVTLTVAYFRYVAR